MGHAQVLSPTLLAGEVRGAVQSAHASVAVFVAAEYLPAGHAQAVAAMLPAEEVRGAVQAVHAPAAVLGLTAEKVLIGHVQDDSPVFVAPPLAVVPTNVPPTAEVRPLVGVPDAQAVHPVPSALVKLAPYLPAGHVQDVMSSDPAAAKEPVGQEVHVRAIFVAGLTPYVSLGHKHISIVVAAHVWAMMLLPTGQAAHEPVLASP